MGTLRRVPALAAVLMIAACAKAQFVSGYPSEPDLHRKLGLSITDWNQIQAEFRNGDTSSYCAPILWARSKLTGVVEVHCKNLKTQSDASGPVFFFGSRDGRWFVLKEMSEWKKDWKK